MNLFADEPTKLRLLQDFPALGKEIDGQKVTYLDSAASSLKPNSVVQAVSDYYSGISCNVHRGKHYALEEASDKFEQARYKVANLIGCSGNEVVFVRNTTEAVNMVALGLGLSKADTVVACSDAHHSNLLPWVAAADTHFVRHGPDGVVDLGHYAELLSKQPKVVALNHCSNVSGVYAPLAEMVKMAKDTGAMVVVDAAQSIPHRRLNVTELDIDFMAFSGHKMLAPTGIGVLYGKKAMLELLTPPYLGGGMVDWVELDHYRLRKLPHRLEAGTPHIAGVIGLGTAVDYLNSLGMERIAEHDHELGQLLAQEVDKRSFLQPVNGDIKADRAAVMSVSIDGLTDLSDVARYLSDSYGIMCRNGHLCAQPLVSAVAGGEVIRVSAYLYNSPEDVRRFFTAIDEIVSFMLPQAMC